MGITTFSLFFTESHLGRHRGISTGHGYVIAIKQLRQQGLSQRAIAITLGVSRSAVIRHLAELASDDAKTPTGSECPARDCFRIDS
jgi:hypothetical protein